MLDIGQEKGTVEQYLGDFRMSMERALEDGWMCGLPRTVRKVCLGLHVSCEESKEELLGEDVRGTG